MRVHDHLNCRALPGDSLPAELTAQWLRMYPQEAPLDSPFFSPEFTRLVALVRGGVDVGVLERDGVPEGFFPYQRGKGCVGAPVAGKLSDFHGVIGPADLEFDPALLLRACRLRAWHFDHLVSSQATFKTFRWSQAPSPFLDLSRGFDAFYRSTRRAGSQTLRQVLRKARKMEREVGPLRFVAHTSDGKVFETAVRWKIRQYYRIRSRNYLAKPWRIELLRRIVDTQTPHFAGMLSALYAADQLAAVHLGMRSQRVLHYWFPGYSDGLAKYSPGLILLARLAQEAENLGIQRIDLGKGDERYKDSLATGQVNVAIGSVDLRRVRGPLRRRWHQVRRIVRESPLEDPARQLIGHARALRRLTGSREPF